MKPYTYKSELLTPVYEGTGLEYITRNDIFEHGESPCIVDAHILRRLPEYMQDYLMEYDYFLYFKCNENGQAKICLAAFNMEDEYFNNVRELEAWVKEQIELSKF